MARRRAMTTPTMEPTSSAVTTEAGGSGIAWAVRNNVFTKSSLLDILHHEGCWTKFTWTQPCPSRWKQTWSYVQSPPAIFSINRKEEPCAWAPHRPQPRGGHFSPPYPSERSKPAKVVAACQAHRLDLVPAYACSLAGRTHFSRPESGISRLKLYQPARLHGLDPVPAYVCSLVGRTKAPASGQLKSQTAPAMQGGQNNVVFARKDQVSPWCRTGLRFCPLPLRSGYFHHQSVGSWSEKWKLVTKYHRIIML